MQIAQARSKNTQLSEADYNLAEVRARGHVLIRCRLAGVPTLEEVTRFKFPVLVFNFPVPSQKFPVPLSREFCSKSPKSLDEWRPLSRELAQN